MNAAEMMELASRLYPISRSLTGQGVRQTLDILSEWLPLEIHEVPTGTEVLDWTIPKEWHISDAWVKDPTGGKIIDFANLNLHVVGYSKPVHLKLSLSDLTAHLHTLPDVPTAVPYRTTYYNEDWGFCLTHEQFENLADGEYEVYIDSELVDGSLTYGEFFHPGDSEDEVFLSSHLCHPSMADDNVSGMVVAAEVGRRLSRASANRMGVRILFAPGTLGTIAWLARNHDRVNNIRGGLTLVCLGDNQPLTYKKTVFGNRSIDRAAELVLGIETQNQLVDFSPYGYDERQHNSPGFRTPVGSLMRSRHGQFREYHTSLDNLEFISGTQLAASADTVERIVTVMDRNHSYRNVEPYGEPQLGRRGLYKSDARGATPEEMSYAMLWVLSLSDGDHDLIDVSLRSGIDFDRIAAAADALQQHHLLEDLG